MSEEKKFEKPGNCKDPAPARAAAIKRLRTDPFEELAKYLASIDVRTEMVVPGVCRTSRPLSVDERKKVDDLRPPSLLIEDPPAPDDMIRRAGQGYDAVLPRSHLHMPMPPVSPPKVEPRDDGGPAFPGGDGQYAGGQYYFAGMSLRDWFAGRCAAAIVGTFGIRDAAITARDAYRMADVMLVERAKEKP